MDNRTALAPVGDEKRDGGRVALDGGVRRGRLGTDGVSLLPVLAIALCAIVVCALGWLTILSLGRESIQSRWIDGLYERKTAAADALPAGKYVLIGGSGVHYGYEAGLLTQRTGLPAVNFGVHAGLGVEYLLYRARQVLEAGDTAILAIEPHLYGASPVSTVLSEFVLRHDWRFMLNTEPPTAVRIVFGISPVAFLMEQVRLTIPWRHQTGNPETVSPNGDETLALSELQAPFQRAALEASGPLETALPASSPRVLADFLVWCKERDVKVLQAWTPFLANPAYSNPSYKRFFDTISEWYERNGVPRIGAAIEYTLPIDDMYDYVLHANERGRRAATEVLARELCKRPELLGVAGRCANSGG